MQSRHIQPLFILRLSEASLRFLLSKEKICYDIPKQANIIVRKIKTLKAPIYNPESIAKVNDKISSSIIFLFHGMHRRYILKNK